MMNYSGSAKFEFYIERYRDLSTGEYYLLSQEDELMEKNASYELREVTLYVEGSSFFEQGNTYGPPENYSPDDGGGDINSLVDDDGNDWLGKLTSDEEERIMEKLDIKVRESCEDDYEEPPESTGELYDYGDYYS